MVNSVFERRCHPPNLESDTSKLGKFRWFKTQKEGIGEVEGLLDGQGDMTIEEGECFVIDLAADTQNLGGAVGRARKGLGTVLQLCDCSP